jgi:DNA-binding SARP family transcriptional activator
MYMSEIARNTESGPPALAVRLLGAFRVEVDGQAVPEARWERRKPRTLVKLLALQRGHRLHRERIGDLLWPELDAAAAANQLSKALHQARRALEPGLGSRSPSRYLVADGSEIVLTAPGSLRIDAEAFERAATEALRGDDPSACERAVALYEGDLLGGDLYEPWVGEPRDRLRVLFHRLTLHVARLHERAGDRARAVESLVSLLAREPANERAHRALMRLYAESEGRHRAVQQFRECEQALRSELDAEPDAATADLLERIVAGEFERPEPVSAPAPATVAPPAPAPANAVRRLAVPAAREPATRRVRAVAACLATILCSTALATAAPWSGELRHRLGRTATKVEAGLARLGGEQPRLVALAGKVAWPGARVEVVDSISGWAAYADEAGRFHLPGVTWYPGATYDLVVMQGGVLRRARVRAPEACPDGDVVDAGDVVADSADEGEAVFGLNSVTILRPEAAGEAYFEGVFAALTSGLDGDEAKAAAVSAFVASRRLRDGSEGPRSSARETVGRGSAFSWDLSLALASIARAGGFEVRMINVADETPEAHAHMVVEVFYDAEWHLFDPTFGSEARRANGTVASYEDFRRAGALRANPAARFPDWLPRAYRSGVHHFYRFA